MAENEHNPLANQLREKANRLENENGNREELNYEVTALMAKGFADWYEDGGPVTKNQCERNRKQHWRKICGIAGAIAAIVGTALSWLYKWTMLKGGN